jgi:transaldolase
MHLFDLRVKLFADGADLAGMLEIARHDYIKGFTTNPSLMRKAGVGDYEQFAIAVLRHIRDRPISFEVFSDELEEMTRQARRIATWGDNVYVKIPVTNTRGESTAAIVRTLAHAGVKVNVTAVFTLEQVDVVGAALRGGAPSIVSIFAGRIADAGHDPVPLLRAAREILAATPTAELLWASPRELLNIVQANDVGCHIITATNDLLAKLHLLGKDLAEFSLDTVRMFHDDARRAGYRL